MAHIRTDLIQAGRGSVVARGHNRRVNIPTILTWLRIAAIPLLIGLYMVPADWLDMATRNLAATVLFAGAAITDALDGYLARKWNQTSSFGAFLDPVADKLMVCAALVLLVQLDRTHSLVALVIIGREITISALREWMAAIGHRGKVAVNWLGKFKTIAQMVAIPFLLYNGKLFGVIDTQQWGTWLIIAAAVLTVWSMLYYFQIALKGEGDVYR
jgi:CDP-diacylglycerol--glycerol-3-phosphate 3-phosphatidyltransferase/cardiolipin synthase